MKTSANHPAPGLILVLCAMCLQVHSEIPPKYQIMEGSVSPDGSLAVLEPMADRVTDDEFWAMRNQIVDVKTQTVIGSIEGVPGMRRMNHGGASAGWSADGKLLFWFVDGKWGPRTVSFVKLKDGKVEQQMDLVKSCYDELLKRAKAAHPKTYAAAKKQNAGSGSALPDGFTASVSLKQRDAMPGFPVDFVVTMTSNPKGIEDYPPAAELEGFLFGTLKESLQIKWGDHAIFSATERERLFAEGEGVDEGVAHLSDAVATALPGTARAKFETGQRDWEKKVQEAGEKWPVEGSVGGCLAEKLRQDAAGKRIKELRALTAKKNG